MTLKDVASITNMDMRKDCAALKQYSNAPAITPPPSPTGALTPAGNVLFQSICLGQDPLVHHIYPESLEALKAMDILYISRRLMLDSSNPKANRLHVNSFMKIALTELYLLFTPDLPATKGEARLLWEDQLLPRLDAPEMMERYRKRGLMISMSMESFLKSFEALGIIRPSMQIQAKSDFMAMERIKPDMVNQALPSHLNECRDNLVREVQRISDLFRRVDSNLLALTLEGKEVLMRKTVHEALERTLLGLEALKETLKQEWSLKINLVHKELQVLPRSALIEYYKKSYYYYQPTLLGNYKYGMGRALGPLISVGAGMGRPEPQSPSINLLSFKGVIEFKEDTFFYPLFEKTCQGPRSQSIHKERCAGVSSKLHNAMAIYYYTLRDIISPP